MKSIEETHPSLCKITSGSYHSLYQSIDYEEPIPCGVGDDEEIEGALNELESVDLNNISNLDFTFLTRILEGENELYDELRRRNEEYNMKEKSQNTFNDFRR